MLNFQLLTIKQFFIGLICTHLHSLGLMVTRHAHVILHALIQSQYRESYILFVSPYFVKIKLQRQRLFSLNKPKMANFPEQQRYRTVKLDTTRFLRRD